MPQITAREALAAPDFQALPLAERIKAMRAIDSDFAALPEPEQYRALGGRQTDAPKNRQIPVLTAKGPAGMRPATEDEYNAFHAEQNEGGRQLFGVAASLAGGPVGGKALSVLGRVLPSGARVLANPWAAGGAAGAVTQAVTGDPATALQVGASVLTGLSARGAVKAANATRAVAAPSLVGGIVPGTTKKAGGKIYEWGTKGGWRSVGEAAAAPTKVSTVPELSMKATRAAKAPAKAQALEAKIVDLKTRQGLSTAQITDAVVETFGKAVKGGTTGIRPNEAKAIVEAVLKAHGLK